jgi:hypothetical protein
MCSIMPSLDLWYRSSICSSGPSCSTFSITLVLVDVERSVFPISLPELTSGDPDAPHESRTEIMSRKSRPPDRRSHVGYCALKYLRTFPPRVRSASDGRSSELRADAWVVAMKRSIPMKGRPKWETRDSATSGR